MNIEWHIREKHYQYKQIKKNLMHVIVFYRNNTQSGEVNHREEAKIDSFEEMEKFISEQIGDI